MNHENNLVQIIKSLDQQILSASGVDSLEEIIKILFLKLFDEIENSNLLFSSKNFKEANKILKLADKKWPKIIKSNKFEIPPKVLNQCLNLFKNIQIFQKDTGVFDTAIEYLLPYTHRGNRGQFMTPRHIISEIIKMVSPKVDEKILDPACGSGGFLEYSILSQGKKNRKKIVQNIYGIDYDKNLSRIAKLVCLNASGEEANITTENSLTKNISQKYDVIVSNPPYGGHITDEKILDKYILAKGKNNKTKKTSRHILFIEKSIQAVKPGGRIALILPQGVLNNSRMENVHSFIFNSCRLLAVISLPESTFMPHTNVKTSILILQKWKKITNINKKNYDVFMSISKKSGKDKKGNLQFKKNKIDHDLEKITEEFRKFIMTKNIKF